ncbi:MAG: DsbA family protein [Proteobacteria bacterium]|nr:DsbA family protein [Pseudomonadota bacterium]
MKLTHLLMASTLALAAPLAIAADAAPMSDVQKQQIEKIMHDYLLNNPEVLLEASQALQQKQQQTMQKQAEAAILQNANQLFTGSAVAGNPKAPVTIVEFFDYQCIHCKKMAPVISELLKKNGNVKVVYKEFPIFGKSSELASKAALAAAMQGKYLALHEALIKQDGRLNEQMIMDAAKNAGLNVEKLKADMESKTVADELEANRKLAENLHLMGTPAFIVAATTDSKLKAGTTPTFIPGAASAETLNDLVKKANT